MKAVIALILALALLAIGIPLSHVITQGEKQTITRTLDPDQRVKAQKKLDKAPADRPALPK